MLLTSMGSGMHRRPYRPLQDFPGSRHGGDGAGVRAALADGRRARRCWQQSRVPVRAGRRHRAVHAGARADRAEHRRIRRPRGGHLRCHVLPHHRKLLRRSDIRLAVRQLPRRPDRCRPWPPAVRHPRPRSRRRRCTDCSPTIAAPIVDAYADSLGTVFLCAAPVAVVGFVVALFLKEVPLREMDAVSAIDLGEGFGMPQHRDAREDPRGGCRPADAAIAGDPAAQHRRPGTAANPMSRCCGRLIQIYRQSQVFGSAAADRHRRAASMCRPKSRTDLRPPGRQRLCAAHRRPALADPGRAPTRSTAASGALVESHRREAAHVTAPSRAGPTATQVEAALERIAASACWCSGTGTTNGCRPPPPRDLAAVPALSRTCSTFAMVGVRFRP